MHIRHLSGKFEPGRKKGGKRSINGDLPLTKEDAALLELFGEYMKGQLDLEEVRNDPCLPETDVDVRELIVNQHADIEKYIDNKKFINEALKQANPDKKTVDEVNNIKLEIEKNNIDEITSEWIKDWNENSRTKSDKDFEIDKIREFITGSHDPDLIESDNFLIPDKIKGAKKPLLIRYISLSAAAVIGALILITSLLQVSDPEKLFTLYYEPFNIVSPLTRSISENTSDLYSDAVEQYKLKDYSSAALGFSAVMLSDTMAFAPRFFMGITQMALENYNNAIPLLSNVAFRQGDYRKEAMWYLGLAYLKTGKTEDAISCFEFLSKSSDFYSERSKKILSRLQ